MELSPTGIIAYITGYLQSLPSAIAHGDVFAQTITLIGFFIAVVIINRLTALLIVVLKKIVLFLIVTLAFWQFVNQFLARVSVEGLTDDTLIFGAIGFIIGFIAIVISLYVAIHSFYEARKDFAPAAQEEKKPQPEGDRTAALPDTPETSPGGMVSAMKDSVSVSSLKSDRSLGAVISYLVIAQFGVFSSKTIPAPSFEVGVAFFAIFIMAGLFFIHVTYNNYLTGIRHLFMAILVGVIIAIVLGHFWGGIPLVQLLSPGFFQSDALVALVTGLALSLFMGGRG